MYNEKLTASQWALNSAVECHPHTVEVIGSNPIAPTILHKNLLPVSSPSVGWQDTPQHTGNIPILEPPARIFCSEFGTDFMFLIDTIVCSL